MTAQQVKESEELLLKQVLSCITVGTSLQPWGAVNICWSVPFSERRNLAGKGHPLTLVGSQTPRCAHNW